LSARLARLHELLIFLSVLGELQVFGVKRGGGRSTRHPSSKDALRLRLR
jgi:hypothetical protein